MEYGIFFRDIPYGPATNTDQTLKSYINCVSVRSMLGPYILDSRAYLTILFL